MGALDTTPPFGIAHRGSRILWPENTMVAFAGAVDLGFEWLETDLHLSSDGVLMCVHDDTLDRTTDVSGPVSRFTARELEQVDAGF
ncbi:MAG: glycerophosphodiester phosphodiesterase family protein, partial [Acidimicrobiia bacterium]|nr:glycerophosphodiester phosphodiesterase family protein [Acidimicrobiia bacterium]